MNAKDLANQMIGLKGYSGTPLSEDDRRWHSTWKPASGHPGGWRVVRGLAPLEELRGKSGRTILFRSYKAAASRAETLNSDEESNNDT